MRADSTQYVLSNIYFHITLINEQIPIENSNYV